MVAHSATKYLNGHSDVVAGALCGSEKIIREVFRGPAMTCGAILSQHDAWLMIRGLCTLSVRMQRIAETTRQVAKLWNPTRRSQGSITRKRHRIRNSSLSGNRCMVPAGC